MGGDDSAESGLQLSSLIPFSQGATSTSSTCSAVSSSVVRLCDDTFSYTNSSIGTGDSIAAEALCFSPEPTDVEEEAEDVHTRARKVSRERRDSRICSDNAALPVVIRSISSRVHERGNLAKTVSHFSS